MIRKFEELDLEPCARILMSVYNHETWQCFWSFEDNNEIFVEEMFVSPELQRQGYGTALLKAVESHIKEKGLAACT